MTKHHFEAGMSASSKRRVKVLLCCFLAWGALIIWRLSQYMIFERDQHLAAMTRESLCEGVIPALRGRILDRDGRPLAWSTRRLALHWRVPGDQEKALACWRRLQRETDVDSPHTAIDVLNSLGREIVVKEALTPEQAAPLASFCRTVRGLSVKCGFERHRCLDSGLQRTLGEVRVIDGVEVGVSGAEKAHDALLRGRSGAYRVMRDKHGSWIPETWRKTREIRPGYDVYLPTRLCVPNQKS